MDSMSASELPARLEKLRYLVEDLRLAYAISRAAPDGWTGRLVARHILIRARDVIEHSRRLRRPIRSFGPTKAFHEAKETYAEWFDEYFATVRDKLGAHVQDLDFGRRIELWKGIETGKVEVFVDGAAQVYGALSALGLPGYVPLPTEPAEFSDPAFASVLRGMRASAGPARAEFATDPLASTRPGTVGGVGFTLLHDRAAQLSLIARWVAWDRETIARFDAFPRVRRILLARLATDVISFADCLVTRRVAHDAPQAMAGLDELLSAEGDPSAALARFLSTYRLDDALARLRPIRDGFGAHLDVDPAQSLGDLLARVDAVDLADALGVFETLGRAFHATCMERIYLRGYVADGRPIPGAVPPPTDAVAAYDPTAPTPAPPRLRSVRDWTAGDFRRGIDAWLRGGEGRRTAAEALGAGLSGSSGEAFTVEHRIGSGIRWETCVLTHAHRAMLDAFRAVASKETFDALLELLLSAGRGYPNRAAETLVRYLEAPGSRWAGPSFHRTLGTVADWDAARHVEPLRAAARPDRSWDLRRSAIVGLFDAFVRFEGVHRLNSGEGTLDLAREVEPWIVQVTPAQELELRLAMGSAFWSPRLGHFADVFESELRFLDRRLQALAAGEFARQGRMDRTVLADRVIAIRDHVTLALLLAEPSPGEGVRELMSLVSDGTIVAGPYEQAGRNLATCLAMSGEFDRALEVAGRLAARAPGTADYELLRLELLGRRPGSHGEVLEGVARLRRDFALTDAELDRVSTLEATPGPP